MTFPVLKFIQKASNLFYRWNGVITRSSTGIAIAGSGANTVMEWPPLAIPEVEFVVLATMNTRKGNRKCPNKWRSVI